MGISYFQLSHEPTILSPSIEILLVILISFCFSINSTNVFFGWTWVMDQWVPQCNCSTTQNHWPWRVQLRRWSNFHQRRTCTRRYQLGGSRQVRNKFNLFSWLTWRVFIYFAICWPCLMRRGKTEQLDCDIFAFYLTFEWKFLAGYQKYKLSMNLAWHYLEKVWFTNWFPFFFVVQFSSIIYLSLML